MNKRGQQKTRDSLVSLTAFLALTVGYIATAPHYHTTAIDSYNFAYIISERGFFDVPARLFLWLSSMQGLYALASYLIAEPDPFFIVGYANAMQTALAAVLLQRLLARHYDLAFSASWLTALVFAASYGTWRYATELEVYASVSLVTIALLLFAFSVAHLPADLRSRRIAWVAVAGTLASLMYQPLGILAAVAIPVFYICKMPIRETVRYYVVYSATLAVGFGFMNWVKNQKMLQVALDADGKLPAPPDLAALAASGVAFLQNLLSVNWAFAYSPTRQFIEQYYFQEFAQELVATDPAFWGYTAFFIALPVALGLLVISLFCIFKPKAIRPFSAQEFSAIAFLVVYALMVLSLHPEGFEAWLPTLVPVFLLLGSRLAKPVSETGHTSLLVLFLATFVLHNWFAGVGVFVNAKRDYNRVLAEPIRSYLDADDLIIIDQNWSFERYANYSSPATTVLLERQAIEDVRARVTDTLASGQKVLIYRDAVAPASVNSRRDQAADTLANELPPEILDIAEKIDLGELGSALLISPGQP